MKSSTKRSFSFPSIYPVACHTDNVGPGSTFVAIKGYNHDGLAYLEMALNKGATTVVVAQDATIPDHLRERMSLKGIAVERVDDTRKALAQLSAAAAGYPAHTLHIIGITGTKGKTTTAWITYEMLHSADYAVALMSGVCNKIKGVEFEAPLTTAQPDYMQQFLKLCVENGVTHVVMEVAAQAVSLHRVQGILFDIVAFTNFGYEHLEFYPTLEDYFLAKQMLITALKSGGTLCLNIDDSSVRRCVGLHTPTMTYSCLAEADVQAALRDDHQGLEFQILYHNRKSVLHVPHLIGVYNLYNALAAATIALALDIDMVAIAAALVLFQGVPGRLEWYTLLNDARVVIDYAHTPDSYTALLSTLRHQTDNLVVIFGAGGKRDRSKRPIMGGIAATYADQIILTSDNPRNEDPAAIVQDIMQGIDEKDQHKVTIQLDRAQAIVQACTHAREHSIIALLGKGNDEYQIIGDVKHYFSERDIIQQCL